MTRYLDPGNPRSSKKEFYSPNIVRRFDEFCTVRTKKVQLLSKELVSSSVSV